MINENRFSTIFYSMEIGIITADESGTTQLINPAAERITGYTRSETRGKPLETIFVLIDEKTGKKVDLPFRKVLKEGKSAAIPDTALLVTMETTAIPVKGNISPLYDRKDHASGIVLVFNDFSPEYFVEKKVKDARYYAESIVDAVRNAIVILDSDLSIISANKSFYGLFDLKPGQTVGKYLHDIDGGTWDSPELKKHLREVILTGFSFQNYEFTINGKEGKPLTLLLNSRLIPSLDKKIRIILSMQDITDIELSKKMLYILEKKVTERTIRLQDANRDLESFSYFVSHGLKAPLRHIMGYINLLARDFPDSISEKSRHYIDTITRSTRQMSTLIEELLNYSKIGRTEIRKTQTDMNTLVREVIALFADEASKRSVTWRVNVLPTVYCDRTLISLVWVNLLSNALKFTRDREKAEITVGYREKEKEFIFFVKDNGVGFNMNYAEKLFQIFQRLHSTKKFPGTGIGLAHVHRIIGKQGGRTWGKSEDGRGATIYFTLPKQEETNG